MRTVEPAPRVTDRTSLSAADGHDSVVVGRYEAIPLPVPGKPRRPRPADRAVVVLSDGTRVHIEPLDAPASVRKASERRRHDSRAVQVRGRVHVVMPSQGAGLLAPCVVDAVVEAAGRGEPS